MTGKVRFVYINVILCSYLHGMVEALGFSLQKEVYNG